MTTVFLSHPSSLRHDTGEGHPERSDRIRAIERALGDDAFKALSRQQSPFGDRATILRVHPAAYVEAIEKASPRQGFVQIDGDTIMSPGSYAAVMHAVGGAVQAVDDVMGGRADNAFLAARPPGHHAERATPMGFCLFNTAAIAAYHARAAHGAERVAVMDFDVHHGNGTQDIFWSDPQMLYASTHQMPLFPGTGAVGERGAHDNIVNAPLSAGADGAVFKEAMETVILPRIAAFRPDLIVISAGFDAHRLDPLANLKLIEQDFAWATAKLMEIAERHAKGRIVSVLEGGYDLGGLSRSVAAHVSTLMGGAV